MIAIAFRILAVIWESAFGRTVLVGVIVGSVAFVKGYAYEYRVKEQQIAALRSEYTQKIKSALAARDSEWQQKLASAEETQNAAMVEAIQAAQSISAGNGGRDELIKLCGTPGPDSADCREGDVYRVRGVQKNPVVSR